MSDFELTDELVYILKRLARTDKTTRARVQEHGIDVIPLDCYSTIPSIDEIENSYEYSGDTPPYLDIFKPEILQNTLEQLIELSAEFNPPADGDMETPSSFFWGNSVFSYSDAMAYYSFVRLARPASIVEIGSGFSTLVAIEAIEKNQCGVIHCIEPYPRQFLRDEQRVELHVLQAQDVSSAYLNDILQDNDILFIDSTHTVKAGSDCLHIYLRLLPKIQRNIYVHVHDVFLPFGMPKHWLLDHQYFWTEQYLLLAFLIDNPKAKVLYGSSYSEKYHLPLMERFMDRKCKTGGCSLWFRYDGSRA
jgi:hypothetical protein